jgi:phosphatidylserine/phosphatidylglycerophosphate/cardiolipin synthase-like enzyme
MLGTSNLDRQSLEHSYEVNVIVAAGALPNRLGRLIDEDIASAQELTAADLERRSWARRLRDGLAAFVLSRV